MKTNSQLSTTEPKSKNKLSKQLEQEQNHRNGELSAGKRRRENGGKCSGNKKHKWQVENRQGEVKNSIGNGEAKESICRIHEHELRGRIAGGNGSAEWREGQRGKNWDNYNDVINEIYF